MPTASSDAAGWNAAYTISASGEKTITFLTQNKFVDQNVRATITTPAVGASTLNITNNTTDLTWGSSSGTTGSKTFSPTTTLTGTVIPATAGWATATAVNVSDTSVTVGKVPQITVGVTASSANVRVTPNILRTAKPNTDTWIDAASGAATGTKPTTGPYVQVDAAANAQTITVQGVVSAAGYGTTADYNSDTATTITAGSAAATTKYIPITEASTFTTSIGTVGSSNLTVGAISNNAYPITTDLSITSTLTAGTPGWFSSGSGTGTKTSVTVGSIPKATFSVNKNAVTVATSGYTTQGTAVTSIESATFANTATAGVTYSTLGTDEADAPILISGSGLFINAGYVGNTYISLAKLVPDTLDNDKIFAPANYILTGYAAWDANGAQITGTMSKYDGSYSIP